MSTDIPKRPAHFDVKLLVEQLTELNRTHKKTKQLERMKKRLGDKSYHGKQMSKRKNEEDWRYRLNQKRYAEDKPLIMPSKDRPQCAAAWGYARISHASQEDGHSVDGQVHRIKQYYASVVEEQGIAWGGVMAEKDHQSAYKKNFSDRPGGRQLLSMLAPGDHVIIDKVDRIWRNNKDFACLLEMFKRNKITLHFVQMSGISCAMNTPMGDFLLQLFVSLGQLESAKTGERNAAVIRHGRQTGNLAESHPLMGCRFVKNGGKRIAIFDEGKRAIMAKVVELYQEGRSWGEVANALEEWQLKESGLSMEEIEAWRDQDDYKPLFDRLWCRKAFIREWQYQHHDIKNAMDLYKIEIHDHLRSFPVDPKQPGSQFFHRKKSNEV